MNRQFFGDTRDLFKYDLVRDIMKALLAFDSFTFIPMLTEDNEPTKRKKNGVKDLEKAVKAGKAGSQNKDLVEHMERLQEIDGDLEYFQTIGAYFKKENIIVDILHKHTFSHEERGEYFDNIITRLPKKSLIFLDPDVGLEESKPSKKHLLFDEVKMIYDTMDSKSVLMVYQHFPREKHDEYLHRRCAELHNLTGSCPITITDNEIVFFVMVKNEKLRENIGDTLSLYADTYPALSYPVAGKFFSRARDLTHLPADPFQTPGVTEYSVYNQTVQSDLLRKQIGIGRPTLLSVRPLQDIRDRTYRNA